MREIMTGIVGCGGIANGKHLPALKNLGNVKLVAFCDIVEERAQKAAEEFGVEGARVYTDYKEMLDKEGAEMEVVHVLTPNSSHSPITIAALESGRHVMCEKPMAKNVDSAKAMLEAAKKTGKVLSIGYQNRYSSQARYLKSFATQESWEIYIMQKLWR